MRLGSHPLHSPVALRGTEFQGRLSGGKPVRWRPA